MKRLRTPISYYGGKQAMLHLILNKKIQFNHYLVKRIERAYIENHDAIKILKSRNVPKAFHYIDPPYVGADQGHYKGYTENQLEDLLTFLSDECIGKFMLSHYPHPLLDEFIKSNNLYCISEKKTLQASLMRRQSKSLKTEILITNYCLNYNQGKMNFETEEAA